MIGRIITFYSWKGGVGRTMSLANVGVQLARRGKRVLLVDWDLEAPGLDRYFLDMDDKEAVTQPHDRTGLLGLLQEASACGSNLLSSDSWERRRTEVLLPELPKSHHLAEKVSRPAPLHLIDSGIRSASYAERLQTFSWLSFFTEHNGAHQLENLRDQWRNSYDFILIDSRTGLTDSGGICTVQMPDTLVLVFTANTQSLEDGLAYLNGVRKARASFAFERASLSVIPLLARWEGDREVDLADDWLDRIEPVVAPLVESWLPSDLPVRRVLERLRVPHVARFSFGEPLPVLTHSLTDPDRPGLAYDLLAELVGNGFSNAGKVIDPSYGSLSLEDQNLSANLIKTGDELLAQGNVTDALQSYQDSLAILKGLAESNPSSTDLQRVLSASLMKIGSVLRNENDLSGALQYFQSAMEICRRLADADPSNTVWQRDLSISLNNAGNILFAQGDLSGARQYFHSAMEIFRRLADDDPSKPLWLRDLSTSLMRIGNVLRSENDLSGALQHFQSSMEITRRLADTDPANAGWQRDLSASLNRIGNVLFDQGDLSGARQYFESAMEIIHRLADADPSNTDWQRDLFLSLNRIGNVLFDQGDLTGARYHFESAIEITRRLANAAPSNAARQRNLCASLNRLASTYAKSGESSTGLTLALESLSITEKLAAQDPTNVGLQRDLKSIQKLLTTLREEST